MIILIAAMDQHRVIGFKNQMPWHIPSELAHFRQTTAGHTVLMGRKTYEAIGRLLPKRHNIIISSKPLDLVGDNVTITSDLEGVLRLWSQKDEALFVIGGAQIYQASLKYADQVMLSVVPGIHEGDTYFPIISNQDFTLEATEDYPEFKVEIYKKRQP